MNKKIEIPKISYKEFKDYVKYVKRWYENLSLDNQSLILHIPRYRYVREILNLKL